MQGVLGTLRQSVRPRCRYLAPMSQKYASNQADYDWEREQASQAEIDWEREEASHAGFGWEEEETKPLTQSEKKALLQRMIRTNILSEVAATKMATGQRCTEQRRPDYEMRQQREAELLSSIEKLAPEHRVRPSVLRPVMSALGFSLGAAASVLPKQVSAAISGGMQEALTEQYNDQLRELREAGLSETSKEFREIVRELRDEERAPLNATQAPDLMRMQRPQELAPEEILAGAVKYSLRGLLLLGSKI